MSVEGVPLSAWEQFGVVVLFCVFVAALLSWFTIQQWDARKSYEKQQTDWQNFISVENEKWMSFIRDERIIYGQTRKDDRDQMNTLETILKHLVDAITAFRQDFNSHSIVEEARMDVLLSENQKAEVDLRSSGNVKNRLDK